VTLHAYVDTLKKTQSSEGKQLLSLRAPLQKIRGRQKQSKSAVPRSPVETARKQYCHTLSSDARFRTTFQNV
jgi:hypothetical protein